MLPDNHLGTELIFISLKKEPVTSGMYWSIKETAGKDLIFLLIVLNLNLKVI